MGSKKKVKVEEREVLFIRRWLIYWVGSVVGEVEVSEKSGVIRAAAYLASYNRATVRGGTRSSSSGVRKRRQRYRRMREMRLPAWFSIGWCGAEGAVGAAEAEEEDATEGEAVAGHGAAAEAGSAADSPASSMLVLASKETQIFVIKYQAADIFPALVHFVRLACKKRKSAF